MKRYQERTGIIRASVKMHRYNLCESGLPHRLSLARYPRGRPRQLSEKGFCQEDPNSLRKIGLNSGEFIVLWQ